MKEQLRSPLKWIGGKYHSAPRIVAAFPSAQEYTTYLEPCGGAAHVLMCKPQSGHREIYNDLNDDLCNFWLQLQERADDLEQRLRALLYSRKLYYTFYERLFDGSEIEPFERAVMWFYVLRSTATGWLRESAPGWNNAPGSPVAYRSVLELFEPLAARLTEPRVMIENRDVERVIEEYDSPTTLHYIDPPYIGAEYYYQAGIRKHHKKLFDHHRLAALLNEVKGYVALSYYPSPELEQWYPQDRWRRLMWQQQKPSDLKAIASTMPVLKEATELLLMNYPARAGLWDEQAWLPGTGGGSDVSRG